MYENEATLKEHSPSANNKSGVYGWSVCLYVHLSYMEANICRKNCNMNGKNLKPQIQEQTKTLSKHSAKLLKANSYWQQTPTDKNEAAASQDDERILPETCRPKEGRTDVWYAHWKRLGPKNRSMDQLSDNTQQWWWRKENVLEWSRGHKHP